MTPRERILLEARLWRTEKENLDKDYFKELTSRARPSILWIESFGNVASVREITNTEPDEIVVYRNIGGQCKSDDPSFMATLEQFVESPDAAYIIVCGHSHCQAIRRIVAGGESGVYAARYVEEIQELYERRLSELSPLPVRQRERKLSELNVRQQMLNLSAIDVLQRAWSGGRKLYILGWYLDLSKGEVEEVYSMTSHDVLTEATAGH